MSLDNNNVTKMKFKMNRNNSKVQRLLELKLERKRLIEWMDMCDANFSVPANEKLFEIETELSNLTSL